MTCPKCKTENQDGNFCSKCANPLRERCSECEKMEPIGRPVCETALEEEKTRAILSKYKERLKKGEKLIHNCPKKPTKTLFQSIVWNNGSWEVMQMQSSLFVVIDVTVRILQDGKCPWCKVQLPLP